jgi:hypothetical protein
MSMVDIANAEPGNIDAVVFLDDFSGTGDTLADWWLNVESIVLPLGVDVLVGTLAMTTRAEDRIREFAYPVTTELLGPEADVLSAHNGSFDDEEKNQILSYCERTGCPPEYLRGYGGAGLLMSFKHGCPNNSLPILWCETDDWQNLFSRRAI